MISVSTLRKEKAPVTPSVPENVELVRAGSIVPISPVERTGVFLVLNQDAFPMAILARTVMSVCLTFVLRVPAFPVVMS